MSTNNYESSYSESGLWTKIEKFAKNAGKEIIFNVLKLYYAMALRKASPAQITAIIAALGYFISPVDAVPDPTPGIGFLDDGGVVSLTIGTIACCSDPEVVNAAKQKVSEWFD